MHHAREHPQIWRLHDIASAITLSSHEFDGGFRSPEAAGIASVFAELGNYVDGTGLNCSIAACELTLQRQILIAEPKSNSATPAIPLEIVTALLLLWTLIPPPVSAAIPNRCSSASNIRIISELGLPWIVRVISTYRDIARMNQQVNLPCEELTEVLLTYVKELEAKDVREYDQRQDEKVPENYERWQHLTAHEKELRMESMLRKANKSRRSKVTPSKIQKKLVISWERGCIYCGRKVPAVDMTVDHVVPVSRGGTRGASGKTAEDYYSSENLLGCCRACNREKGSQKASSWIDKWARSPLS